MSAAAIAEVTVKVTPDEYNEYLRRVYKAADFKKPEHLVGLTKSLPPEQMKKLILANTKVTDADLRNLANDFHVCGLRRWQKRNRISAAISVSVRLGIRELGTLRRQRTYVCRS